MLKQVRGTQDIIDKDYKKIKHICDVAYKVASNYGFTLIETPIIEYTEVFTRTLGQDSDIITKEMYTFTDKNGSSVTLRPEFTASIARAFITNNLEQLPSPLKLFCSGPLFRYERPQKGRQRQFNQVNFEILGEESYIADVEVISLAYNFLSALGICDKLVLELNSLGDKESYSNYHKALKLYLLDYKEKLSEDSKKRLFTNPLRILDSKDESDRLILQNAPKIDDYYNTHSQDFFTKIKENLDSLKIKYTINQHLVRGLDYYCHTTFEFVTKKLGSHSAILAGGRYDKLIEQMGGKKTPAIGFAGGIERISELISPIIEKKQIFSIIPISEKEIKFSMILAHQLRRNNINVNLITRGNLQKRLKKSENNYGVIIIGAQEVQNNQVTLKNMQTGTQKSVDAFNIITAIKDMLI